MSLVSIHLDAPRLKDSFIVSIKGLLKQVLLESSAQAWENENQVTLSLK